MTRAIMLVAAHKAAAVPSDDFYMPVHVGHVLNPVDLGYQPDDEGDNISALNGSFCELTALYWAWQNLDTDVIGLSHYRRYFVGNRRGPNDKLILSEPEAVALLGRADIVLGRARNYYIETIESHYRNGHYGSDLVVLRDVIARKSPNYLSAYDQVFGGRRLSLYNMFIMRWELFDQYMTWLMSTLFECQHLIDNQSRTPYQQRTFGYLGERLLNVWAEHQRDGLRIAYLPVVNTDGEPKIRKGIGLVRRKYSHLRADRA